MEFITNLRDAIFTDLTTTEVIVVLGLLAVIVYYTFLSRKGDK